MNPSQEMEAALNDALWRRGFQVHVLRREVTPAVVVLVSDVLFLYQYRHQLDPRSCRSNLSLLEEICTLVDKAQAHRLHNANRDTLLDAHWRDGEE